MNKRLRAQQVEKYLEKMGHVRDTSGEFRQTLNPLTGEAITARLGAFHGQRAVAMLIGDDDTVICLTLEYIESVLDHCLAQSQLRLTASPDISQKSVTTIEPTSGAVIEAALITIEGEELVEIFFSDRVEPVVLEPGFLVELMLELHI